MIGAFGSADVDADAGTGLIQRCVFIFTGVGVVKLLSCTILCLYYPILMVNTIFYSIWSLYQPLPTSQCITKLLPKFTTQVSSKTTFTLTTCQSNV